MKNQKGAIALVTLGTVIFMLAFLLSSFVIIQNRIQAQAEIKKETAKLYEKDLENRETIYQKYFAASTEVVPITNAEQLLSIGSNKEFAVNGKIYKYSANKDYILKDNIYLDVENYKNQYADKFSEYTVTNIVGNIGTEIVVNTWIGIDGLKSRGFLTGKFDGQSYEINVKTPAGSLIYSAEKNFYTGQQ